MDGLRMMMTRPAFLRGKTKSDMAEGVESQPGRIHGEHPQWQAPRAGEAPVVRQGQKETQEDSFWNAYIFYADHFKVFTEFVTICFCLCFGFLSGISDLKAQPGTNPLSLHWKAEVLPTGLPEVLSQVDSNKSL